MVQGKKFEVGKIYSFGKYILHTPYKFVKVVNREGDQIYLEDITGSTSISIPFYDKTYANETVRNSEVMMAKSAPFTYPTTVNAVNEVLSEEIKFMLADHFSDLVDSNRVKEFFNNYLS